MLFKYNKHRVTGTANFAIFIRELEKESIQNPMNYSVVVLFFLNS
jgi:hypothetical protein